VVDVDDVGATRARTLDNVDHRARALLADLLDEPHESVRIAVTICPTTSPATSRP